VPPTTGCDSSRETAAVNRRRHPGDHAPTDRRDAHDDRAPRRRAFPRGPARIAARAPAGRSPAAAASRAGESAGSFSGSASQRKKYTHGRPPRHARDRRAREKLSGGARRKIRVPRPTHRVPHPARVLGLLTVLSRPGDSIPTISRSDMFRRPQPSRRASGGFPGDVDQRNEDRAFTGVAAVARPEAPGRPFIGSGSRIRAPKPRSSPR